MASSKAAGEAGESHKGLAVLPVSSSNVMQSKEKRGIEDTARLRFYHCHKHKRCKTRRLSRAACVAWVSFSLGFV